MHNTVYQLVGNMVDSVVQHSLKHDSASWCNCEQVNGSFVPSERQQMRGLTWRSEVICTDLKLTSSFHTGCACPMATLVRFIWFSHCNPNSTFDSEPRHYHCVFIFGSVTSVMCTVEMLAEVGKTHQVCKIKHSLGAVLALHSAASTAGKNIMQCNKQSQVVSTSSID